MRRAVLTALAATAALAGVPIAAGAGEPAAIVEDAAGASGLQVMDYVEPGHVVKLGPDGRLVLGYLGSCQRETVVGGVVTVGRKQSAVKGGKVTRERVECDGGQLSLTTEQAAKSGVFVMRRPPGGRAGAAEPPRYRIFSTAPVVTVSSGATTLSIRRIDVPEAAIELPLGGRTVDLAARGIALKAGATYRAEAGGRSVVFGVSAFASSSPGPVIGRLVRL